MHVCVCLRRCMCVWICVLTYAPVCVLTYLHTSMPIYPCVRVCVCECIYSWWFLVPCVNSFAGICIWMHEWIYVDVNIDHRKTLWNISSELLKNDTIQHILLFIFNFGYYKLYFSSITLHVRVALDNNICLLLVPNHFQQIKISYMSVSIVLSKYSITNIRDACEKHSIRHGTHCDVTVMRISSIVLVLLYHYQLERVTTMSLKCRNT